MGPSTTPKNSKRQLGLGSASALVVASMIGAGVFTTSGFLLADLGSPWVVLIAWLVGGGIAAMGALSYGALARRIPESGGEYLFLSRTIHPAVGFVAGWISLWVGFSAPLAAAAFGFGEYTKPWFGGCSARLSGTFLVVLFAGIHAAHVRRGARIQDLAVLIKVIIVFGFIALGSTRLTPTTAPWPNVPVSSFAVSLVWISFSYSGWNAAIYIGGEIKDPERNLPRSLLLGTGLVTLLYLGLNAVFLFSTSRDALAGKLEIGRIAAKALGGPALAEAIAGLIALALLTSVSSLLMAGPRVYARMAEDGYLSRRLISEQGPPRVAIMLQTALALAMLWTATYENLLTYIGFTLGLCSAATVAGLIKLRLREGAALRVPGWPWVPGLFLAAVLTMTAFTVARRPLESLWGFATMALGWLIWKWQEVRRAAATASAPA